MEQQSFRDTNGEILTTSPEKDMPQTPEVCSNDLCNLLEKSVLWTTHLTVSMCEGIPNKTSEIFSLAAISTA